MNPELKEQLKTKVEQAIETIRPYLEADGGDITVDEITDQFQAVVRLHGACSSCSMSEMTLKAGVAEAIKNAVPEIKEVLTAGLSVPSIAL